MLLVPGPGAPEQAVFLRWLVYIVANIYPTFTYADDPSRFVSTEAARAPFRQAVGSYGERLWVIVEDEAKGPWFLGNRFSAIDPYVTVMRNWRPNPDGFVANTPKLKAIALEARAMDSLRACWTRNFPDT